MTAPVRDRLVPIEQAADMLGLARQTLYKWRSSGEGPESFVVGRQRVVYRESVLLAYIAECEAAERARRK